MVTSWKNIPFRLKIENEIGKTTHSAGSSSSSRNEYYLGGTVALLLQDHHTVSTKSVCNSQYMVTDQHWTTGEQIKYSTLSDRVREWRPEQNGLQFSAEDGKRGRVPNVLWTMVERSTPVRQPLRMTDHRESNDAWMVGLPEGLTSRRNGGVDVYG